MALWTGAIQKVNEGFAANDGTGDTIRLAFTKTDSSFAAVNSFLSATTQDFLNANIAGLVQANVGSFVGVNTINFNANTATITRIDGLLGLSVGGNVVVTGNLSVANNISAASVVTGTLQAATLGANIDLNNYNIGGNGNIVTTGTISTSNLVSNNTTATGTSTVQNLIVQGNLIASTGIMVTSSIVPTGNLQYDLGSPTNYFRNVYSQGLVEVNTVVLNNNDNILRLHSNIPAGDVRDVGILGEFNKNSANSYAYFGYQYASGNFVYKVTPTDATTGTGVVNDGVYGNAQFGSVFLSNNIAGGNTLVVSSGAVISGNTHSSNFVGNFVGNLTGTAATVGTVTAGNINSTGTVNTASVVATGNIVANYHLGNLIASVANITTITASSILSTGNIVASYYLGNIVATTANIASLSVSAVNGNLAVGGVISSTGATIAGNVNVANSVNGNVNSPNANITNLTVGNVAGNMTVSGNISSAGFQVLTINNFSQYLPALNNATNVVGDSYFTGNMIVAGTGGFKTASNIYAGFGSGASFGFYGNLYGLVTNPVQPGITSVGALGNLSVTNTTSTNVLNVNTLNATNATVSGALVAGTTTVAGLTATSLSVTGNTTVNNLAVTGTISTGTTISASATSNSLTSGNITVTGNITANNVSVTSNITASNIVATAIYSNGYRFANGAAFVSTTLANTAEITANTASGANAGFSLVATGVGAGTYGSATQVPVITVDTKGRIGTVTVANISGALTFTGDATGTGTTGSSTALTLSASGVAAGTYGSATSIPAINIDAKGRITAAANIAVSSTLSVAGTTGTGTVSLLNGTLTFAGTNGVTATVSGGTVTISEPQDLRTNATPTFTSINSNLNSTSINTSSITAGTVSVSGSIVNPNGTIRVDSDLVPNTNNIINLGSLTKNFATVYATIFSGVSTTARYADLAEIYAADAEYKPGTVVVFGGDAEITVTNQFADVGVAGAISTNPAYLMNDSAAGVPVALRGRVPIQVIGPVYKGDLLVTAGQNPGYATSIGRSTEYPLAVFAKAIETNTAEGKKVIEAVII
jgi:hypothetical protein